MAVKEQPTMEREPADLTDHDDLLDSSDRHLRVLPKPAITDYVCGCRVTVTGGITAHTVQCDRRMVTCRVRPSTTAAILAHELRVAYQLLLLHAGQLRALTGESETQADRSYAQLLERRIAELSRIAAGG